MHRSRLAGFIIDSNTDDLEAAAEFWSAALGYAAGEPEDGDASTPPPTEPADGTTPAPRSPRPMEAKTAAPDAG